MKFIIDHNVLYSALTHTAYFGANVVKIDANMEHVTFTSYQSIYVYETDGYAVREIVDASVEEPGTVVLNLRFLKNIASRAEGQITISVDSSLPAAVEVTTDKTDYKAITYREKDFPNLKFDYNITGSIPENVIRDLIDKTVYAVSKKDLRPVLTGVNMCFGNDKLIVTATDSYRLARTEMFLKDAADTRNITVPAKVLNAVKTIMLDGKGDDSEEKHLVNISIDRMRIVFSSERVSILSPLLSGSYPQTDRLFPNYFENVLKVDRRDLMNVIARSQFIQNERIPIVSLEAVDEARKQIEFTSQNHSVGASRQIMDANIVRLSPNLAKISFNGAYMLEALKVIPADEVTLSIPSNRLKLIVVTADACPNDIHLLMQIRTYN